MSNSFVYIAAVLFAVAFSSFVSYDSEKMRASRCALGIILLAALVAPLTSLIGEFENLTYGDFPSYDSSAEEQFRDQSIGSAFVRGVELAVAERFSFSEDEVEVECFGFALEEARAEKIHVTLSGRAAFADIRAVRDYVENSRLGECEVTVVFE